MKDTNPKTFFTKLIGKLPNFSRSYIPSLFGCFLIYKELMIDIGILLILFGIFLDLTDWLFHIFTGGIHKTDTKLMKIYENHGLSYEKPENYQNIRLRHLKVLWLVYCFEIIIFIIPIVVCLIRIVLRI